MRKFITILIFSLILNGAVLDKIVATVNNQPITTYDIQQLSNKLHITQSQALQLLINQKLIESEIKKRGISVDEFDIDNAMEKIAMRKHLSLFEFKDLLSRENKLKYFTNSLKFELQKERLFNQIIQSKLSIKEEELKSYYKQHKNKFKTCKNISYIKYFSLNPNSLKQIIQNPLSNIKNVKIETKNSVLVNSLPLNLIYLFNNTPENSYTPIIPDNIGYSVYFIEKKEGSSYIPYKKVKNLIYDNLIKQKRDEILNSYINKLKNRANIKIFR